MDSQESENTMFSLIVHLYIHTNIYKMINIIRYSCYGNISKEKD